MKMTLKFALALLLMVWYQMESPLPNTLFFEKRETLITIYNLKQDSLTQPLRYARVTTREPVLHLKTAPSVSAPFLDITIPQNEIIEVLADVPLSEKENGRWYRVRFGLVEGYVLTSEVRCEM